MDIFTSMSQRKHEIQRKVTVQEMEQKCGLMTNESDFKISHKWKFKKKKQKFFFRFEIKKNTSYWSSFGAT